MSRLGKQPVSIPQGVECTLSGSTLTVRGPKGTLTRDISKAIKVEVADGAVTLSIAQKSDDAGAQWGTAVAHLKNMFRGVTEGFKKELEIEGVGYRAEAQGQKLKLSVGFSHPVELIAPQGVGLAVEKNKITVSGIDCDAVGQFAANVRATKKPEPYKGKGIHYVGEYIIRKQGKRGVA
jgi:large subunit ribosomal protein L6